MRRGIPSQIHNERTIALGVEPRFRKILIREARKVSQILIWLFKPSECRHIGEGVGQIVI